ncbi:PTS fructose transporter subunit IIA [Ligilactobacillus acidipiscis]|uniref:PTS fructose transporter subunit IIA n=1 Tax=Ligilactobacillus acidipiscis TaxID=89059 RepID=UPI0023F9B47E|nr:PTS fructose transporter subunit IIA [Ligilactobacillus acidipiscis]WEV57561.1 PTS fructose transporter subunit IIA [Ligilactobacillus acidipiscis]
MFDEQNIFFNLEGEQQNEILKALSKIAAELGVTEKPKRIYKDYLKREKESTTGFGNGIAIPHAKSKSILKPTIIFARSQNKIDWNSLDEEPVNNYISILVPEKDSKTHLNLLAELSRNLVYDDFINTLKNGSKDEVYHLIEKAIGEE